VIAQHDTECVIEYDVPELTRELKLENPPRLLIAETERAAMVHKMRALADALEQGELNGVRIEWREGLDFLTTVEMDTKSVSLFRYDIVTVE
jgi:hypothetical protein